MFSNPIKILLASSLIVSGVGVMAIQIFVEKEDNTTSLVSHIQSDGSEFVAEDSDLFPASSAVNSQNGTLNKCSIYGVERSSSQKDRGDQNTGKIRRMWSVSKIIKKFKDAKTFLDERRSGYSSFVSDVENKGCKKFEKVYVYQLKDSGIYTSDLQGQDWAQILKIPESSIIEN